MSLKQCLAAMLAAGTQTWRRIARHGGNDFQIVILHHVADHQSEVLCAFLDFVQREHGFITPREAEIRLSATGPISRPPGQLPCLISFDDGFRSAGQVAEQILPRYGVKALFFVCPGLMDLPSDQQDDTVLANVFAGRRPQHPIPALMTWPDVMALHQAGHTIGAHGSMHLRLSKVDNETAAHEIMSARDRIETQMGQSPDWYAYAFGDIGAISAPAIRTILTTFRYCRSGIRGINGPENPHRVLMAQEIDLDMPTAYHRSILKGGLDIRYIGARRRFRQYAEGTAPQ